MRIYTTNAPLGPNCQYKGFVIANQVRVRNAFSTMGSEIKSLFGGQLGGVQKLTSRTRNEVIDELVVQAQELGANAIYGINLETTVVFDMAMDIVAFGTAVYEE